MFPLITFLILFDTLANNEIEEKISADLKS